MAKITMVIPKMNPKKIHRSIMVDQKHVDWLDLQPRTFNLSKKCREMLDSLMGQGMGVDFDNNGNAIIVDIKNYIEDGGE